MPPLPFSCRTFSRPNLFDALSNENCPAAGVAENPRATYLFRYLEALKAQTIVVEREYVDRDFLEDYASYYVRCFKKYPSRCTRLHFFAHPFADDDLFSAITSADRKGTEQKLKDSYLGFVVARPLPVAIVGRTALKTYEADGRRFFPCTSKYAADLFGIPLEVESVAYQEQDTVLAACATVSLWSCFSSTHRAFGFKSPTPAEITGVANQVIHGARPIPSRGLIVEQICNAIRQVGLEPEVFKVNKTLPIPSLLYAHLRAGIPALLVVEIEGVRTGLHAVAVLGYSLRDKPQTFPECPDPGSLNMIGRRINELYVHDDQVGPFCHMHVKPSVDIGTTTYPVVFDGTWIDPGSGAFRRIHPRLIILPLYHKIRVTFVDIQQWLVRLTEIIEVVTPESEWDIWLTTTNEMKEAIRHSAEYAPWTDELLLRQHPRFVWRCLLRVDGRKALELFADATDMARSFPFYIAIWHDDNLRVAFRDMLNSPGIANFAKEILSHPFFAFIQSELDAPAASSPTVDGDNNPPPQ